MDAAGTVIGATGLFLQVFEGCVNGFSLWNQGEDIGPDALIFKVRLDLQAAKLRAWAFEWEIDRGSDSAYFHDTRFNAHADTVIQTLMMIYELLDALKQVESDHPAVAQADTHSVTAAGSFANLASLRDGTSTERKDWVGKMVEIRGEASLNQRLQWALKSGRATSTLETLSALIKDLYELLPPPRGDPAALVVMNRTLPSRNVPRLSAINPDNANNPLLTGLAKLRVATAQLQDRASALEDIKVNEKIRNLQAAEPFGKSMRSLGTFKDGKNGAQDVLVEWKLVNTAQVKGTAAIFIHEGLEQRIKNIARLLKSDGKPAELRTLPCIGVVAKSGASDAEKRYGLIYRVPSTRYSSLSDTLKTASGGDFFLEDRFSSAVVLCKAVLYLHMAGWLHKGIRGDNVVFFADGTGAGDPRLSFGKPYLIGFDYSRENAPNAQTEDVMDDLEWNLYRHPDVQGVPDEGSSGDSGQRLPFSALHDIYGLGVVLLEIGLLETATAIYDSARQDLQYGAHSAKVFRSWLLATQVPRLGPLAGKGYMQAVEACLTGNLEATGERSLVEAFYSDVVLKVAGPTSQPEGH